MPMMKTIKCLYSKWYILSILLFLIGGTAASGNAFQEKHNHQKVLVVNSYHPGYTWSDDIMLGIRDEFGKHQGIELIIEHLDTKRHFEKSYFRQVEELFRHKYRSNNIDIIITSDDNALDFILSIRKELFPDIPLVVCRIDHIHPGRIANQKSVYGIR